MLASSLAVSRPPDAADDVFVGDGGGGNVGNGVVEVRLLVESCGLAFMSSSVATIRLSPLCISNGVPIKCRSLMCNCSGSCLCAAVGIAEAVVARTTAAAASVVVDIIADTTLGYDDVDAIVVVSAVAVVMVSLTVGVLPISFSSLSCRCGLPEVHPTDNRNRKTQSQHKHIHIHIFGKS